MAFRQDIGKFSCHDSVIFFKFTGSFRKRSKVFIFNTNKSPIIQHESMLKMYMNRFAIEEDDQFEIHVKRCAYQYLYIDEKVMYNAAKEVMLKAQQGSGFPVKFE